MPATPPNTLQYDDDPGSIRISGMLGTKLAVANSRNERYAAAVDLQEHLVRNMGVEKKTWIGKVWKSRLVRAGLLVGFGALLPYSGSILSTLGSGTVATAGAIAESGIAQNAVKGFVDMSSGEKALTALGVGGAAGLGIAGIWQAKKVATEGRYATREARKAKLNVLQHEQQQIRLRRVRIKKDDPSQED